jgi:hypothetical protein
VGVVDDAVAVVRVPVDVVAITVSVVEVEVSVAVVGVAVSVCTVVKIDSVHVRPPNEGAHAHSNVRSILLLVRSS